MVNDHYPYSMAISLGIYPIFRQTHLLAGSCPTFWLMSFRVGANVKCRHVRLFFIQYPSISIHHVYILKSGYSSVWSEPFCFTPNLFWSQRRFLLWKPILPIKPRILAAQTSTLLSNIKHPWSNFTGDALKMLHSSSHPAGFIGLGKMGHRWNRKFLISVGKPAKENQPVSQFPHEIFSSINPKPS